MRTTTEGAAPRESQKTAIWWPLQGWIVVEIGFGIAAILTLVLRPEDTRTRFAWPLLPFALMFQLNRFGDQVDWGNLSLWVLIIDVALVAALSMYLWATLARKRRAA
ncbi:hypothetical protein BH24ACT26_BH24ACT26_18370 [soil metagenome]